MEWRQVLLSATLAVMPIGVASPTSAQALQYNNDGERLGACVGPRIRLMVFEKMIAYTKSDFPKHLPAFEEAVAAWKVNNRDYLRFSTRLIEANQKIAKDPRFDKATRDSSQQLVEVIIPNGAKRLADTLIGSIDDLKPAGAAEKLLLDYIDSIKNGKWDVRAREPELAGFMDKKIEELKSQSQW